MVSLGPLLSALHSSSNKDDNTNNNILTYSTNNISGSNGNATKSFLAGNISSSGSNSSQFDTFSKVLHVVKPEEVVILGIIVCMWVVAVLAFLKKWGSIRILQPIEPRYRHSPKNLESVRVVKRAQDSVIYKNYSRKMSVTMVARENRRLQRMHTVPIMGTLPTIAMETGTTEI